jgi:hypothetical protein
MTITVGSLIVSTTEAELPGVDGVKRGHDGVIAGGEGAGSGELILDDGVWRSAHENHGDTGELIAGGRIHDGGVPLDVRVVRTKIAGDGDREGDQGAGHGGVRRAEERNRGRGWHGATLKRLDDGPTAPPRTRGNQTPGARGKCLERG